MDITVVHVHQVPIQVLAALVLVELEVMLLTTQVVEELVVQVALQEEALEVLLLVVNLDQLDPFFVCLQIHYYNMLGVQVAKQIFVVCLVEIILQVQVVEELEYLIKLEILK